MVGHRFVQELRDRDLAETHNVVVLSEEPVTAYDRVGLSGYVGAWDRRRWRCPETTMPVTISSTCGSGRRRSPSTRRLKTVITLHRRPDRILHAGAGHGLYPFVPGRRQRQPRAFVYRTLADLDAIRATAQAAGPGAPGVVVGGRLLGLEAANALRLLGMSPHIVEFAPG